MPRGRPLAIGYSFWYGVVCVVEGGGETSRRVASEVGCLARGWQVGQAGMSMLQESGLWGMLMWCKLSV